MKNTDMEKAIIGYEITEFEMVEAGDVGTGIYFTENIGVSMKSVVYASSSNKEYRKEVFTYNNDFALPKTVLSIFNFRTDKFVGAWAGTSYPADTELGIFYVIGKDVIIDTVQYYKNDIIGRVDAGYSVIEWAKCKLNDYSEPVRA